MKPVVGGLDERYGDKVAFANVDYNSAPNAELAERYEVLGHPTYVVLGADGEVIQSFRGYTEGAELEAALQEAAGTAR